jgi:hypothetical protein
MSIDRISKSEFARSAIPKVEAYKGKNDFNQGMSELGRDIYVNVLDSTLSPVAQNTNAETMLKMVEDGMGNSYGFKTVGEALNKSSEAGVDDGLRVLALGVYEGMRSNSGVKDWNADMTFAIGKASKSEIDSLLPDPLKGLGGKIVEVMVGENDKNFVNDINKLDKMRSRTDMNNAEQKVDLASECKELSKSIRKSAESDACAVIASYLSEESRILESNEKVFPKEQKEQLIYVRGVLNEMEKFGYDIYGPGLEESRYYQILTNIFNEPGLDPEVKREAVSRVNLQSIYNHMSSVNGVLDPNKGNSMIIQLGKAAGGAGKGVPYYFTTENLKFYFGKDTGIGSRLSQAMARAWDIYQDINMTDATDTCGGLHTMFLEMMTHPDFLAKNGLDATTMEYRDLELLKIATKKNEPKNRANREMWADLYTNYFQLSDGEVKNLINRYIEYKLIQEGYSEQEAAKGRELSWNTAVATGETSLWNWVFIETDDVAETAYTWLDTVDRIGFTKGKSIGSLTMWNKVETMGTSYLRFLSNRTVFGKIKSSEIKTDKRNEPKTDLAYFWIATMTNKVFNLKSMLRKEDFIAGKVSADYVKSMIDAVTKTAKLPTILLDKKNKPIINTKGGEILDAKGRPLVLNDDKESYMPRMNRLKYLIVASWADMACTNETLGWNEQSWKDFRNILIQKYSVTTDNGSIDKISFITEKELNEIENKVMGKFGFGIMTNWGRLRRIGLRRNSMKAAGYSLIKTPGPQIVNL